MSQTLIAGADALTQAATSLKTLAAEAIARNEWDAVSTLAAWARALQELLDQAHGAPMAVTAVATTARLTPRVAVLHAKVTGKSKGNNARKARAPKPTLAPATRSKGLRGGRNQKSAAYPRFLRDRNALVKIGWSRKSKTEYEHRAPRAVVDHVVDAVRQLGNDGARFAVDDLLTAIAALNVEIPSYQTYLCIGWMRANSLLEQHGRQGYSLVEPTHLEDQVAAAWDATAAKG
jgi:hypothetical protein